MAGSRWLVLLAASMNLLAVPSGAQSDTATLSGTVIDAVSRAPMGGVVVRLQTVPSRATPLLLNPSEGSGAPPPPPEPFSYHATVVTGADGRFRFAGLRPGNYHIGSSRNGWLAAPWEAADADLTGDWMTLRPSANAAVTLPMRRVPVIAGRVIDETGNPAVGVRVRAFSAHPVSGHVRWSNWLPRRTDDRGAFRLWVSPGTYIVGVTPGSPTSPAESLYAGTTNGRPLGYAAQYLRSAGSTSAAEVLSLAAGDERADLEFRLAAVPLFAVSGKVVGAEDPTRVQVRLHSLDDMLHYGSDDPMMTRPDAAGRFAFKATPAGRYRVRAFTGPNLPIGSHGVPALEALPPEATLAADADVQVADGDVDLTLTLAPGVRIDGRVEFEGEPSPSVLERLKHIPVIVEPADGGPFDHGRGIYVEARTFTTTQVPSGKYIVRTYAPEGWLVKSIERDGQSLIDKAFEIGGKNLNDVVITYTSRASWLTGLVTDASSARRRPWVVAFPVNRDQWMDFGRSPRCIALSQVGTLGTYEMQLPAGGYYVVAVYDQPALLVPGTFERLAAVATQVWLGHGERREQPLRSVKVEVRR